ncbi:MAG: DUF732 domain-containing protein, partial [Nocardia sp.]|nr:DUF732 domain-containing protein [Nocardia sp.]
AANVYFPSDAAALSEGHRACAMYSTGSDNVAVAKQITQDLPDLTHDDALAVERAATQAYCTQFS